MIIVDKWHQWPLITLVDDEYDNNANDFQTNEDNWSLSIYNNW
jgi:hypothetical protein